MASNMNSSVLPFRRSGEDLRSMPRQLDGGGDGPHDGGMEVRVAKLETNVEHILRACSEIKADAREFRSSVDTRLGKIRDDMRTDFFWLLGGGIAATLLLLGVLAKGFHWV